MRRDDVSVPVLGDSADLLERWDGQTGSLDVRPPCSHKSDGKRQTHSSPRYLISSRCIRQKTALVFTLNVLVARNGNCFSFQRVARGGEVDLISTTADHEFNAPELIIHLFSVNEFFAITRSTNLLSMCRYIILFEPKQWLTSCKWTPLADHKCSNQS